MAVFGAYGHTGRFVVAELRERGYVPLLLGRDQGKLLELALAQDQPGLEARQASVDDPASLDRAERRGRRDQLRRALRQAGSRSAQHSISSKPG
ncbi:hypothetical protein AB0F17_50390 [Nonomuraea sp. NPDC026600]|uniref:hypothetical protein n=1 Tax=Nonomuraea sp. NPDC026600 TaxID=3155363 RepID=UPI0033CF0040